MQLKSVPLFLLLPTLVLVLIGCREGSQPPHIPTTLPIATSTFVPATGTHTPPQKETQLPTDTYNTTVSLLPITTPTSTGYYTPTPTSMIIQAIAPTSTPVDLKETRDRTDEATEGSATISQTEPTLSSGEATSFSDEQHQCLVGALGSSTMEELANRDLTEQELAAISHCNVGNIFRHDDSENHQSEGSNGSNVGSNGYGAMAGVSSFNTNDYPRVYREVIKGIWEPGGWDQLASFVSDASGQQRLESLGINTISVVGSFDVLEGGRYKFPFTLAFIETEIVRYKKLGFSVFLSGNSRGTPSDADPEQALEHYLLSCKMAAIELARLGEQYNVEYFSPGNEFEGSLDDEAFPSRLQSYNPPETPFDPPDAGTDARVQIASEWFEDILPDLKQEFSGRIIAKVGQSHSGYSVQGYDYLAFTIDHQYLGKEDFRRLVSKNYRDIAQSAVASGISWMVGEAYFHYGDKGSDLDAGTKNFLKDMQQHYFEISLDEYLGFDQSPRPSGYIFIGYFMDGIEIKDSSSETVIRDYFTLIK